MQKFLTILTIICNNVQIYKDVIRISPLKNYLSLTICINDSIKAIRCDFSIFNLFRILFRISVQGIKIYRAYKSRDTLYVHCCTICCSTIADFFSLSSLDLFLLFLFWFLSEITTITWIFFNKEIAKPLLSYATKKKMYLERKSRLLEVKQAPLSLLIFNCT